MLPIVVYVGEGPWPGPTRMEDLLAGEARAILPFALGQEFVLVWEALEARALASADTSWAAGLRLRYTRDRGEFVKAYGRLRELLPELLPEDGVASRALATWVRSALIEDGAKEAEVSRLQRLGDLERVAQTFWGAERLAERRKGRAEGRAVGRAQGRKEATARARREQRATLVRQAGRKFGSETAEGLASLLEGVGDSERVAEIADLIIDCTSGGDFLARAARLGTPEDGSTPSTPEP